MLIHQGYVDLPRHEAGDLGPGDVDWASGRVYVARPANNAVEVLDGEINVHLATIDGCSEASGVLCAQDAALTFAAARGAGQVLVIDSAAARVLRRFEVGPDPNVLGWDAERGRLFVASAGDCRARLVDPSDGREIASAELLGPPRSCVYDRQGDRFLVTIAEPASLEVLAAASLARLTAFEIPSEDPRDLDLDEYNGRALVACDGGLLVAIDLQSGGMVASVPLSGETGAIWHNRSTQRLYVAVGHPGVVQVVDTGTLTVVEEITTEEGAQRSAFDPVRQKLYVFLARSCRVGVYFEI
jgi:DNA-binding beta-propeller fold protein YncE